MRLDEFEDAAIEALWMCRLAESRLRDPSDPPALDRYQPVGIDGHPWKYDYYSHVLASQRLMNAVEALNEVLGDESLSAARRTFQEHWNDLRSLRNVLQHPKNTGVLWQHVSAYHDRIAYQLPGCDPQWVFTLTELHDPVESLWSAAHEAREAHGGSRYEEDGRLRPEDSESV